MKRFFQTILATVGFCSGCSRTDVLTPAQFTDEFAQDFRKSSVGLKVEIVKDLELKVTAPDGGESTSFLYNAYDTYKQDPKSKREVIHRYVVAGLDTVARLQVAEKVDRNRIVPVVKDRPWIEETRQAMLNRGAKKLPSNVFEELNADLIILYAEDSPKNIRYLSPKDLEDARIDRKELRSIACENLRRLLPKVEMHGTNGVYMLTAGGDYEASLLLIDSVRSAVQKQVKGDIVFGIPARDLLIVTGSEDHEGIKRVKEIIQKDSSQTSYRLTTKLFVLRAGEFIELNVGAAP